MSGATAELENGTPSKSSQFQRLFQHTRTVRGTGIDIQSSISKISPEILKTMIGTTPISSPGIPTTPLTIFYNGTVSVFNMPHDKAENILKLAEDGNLKFGEHKLLDKDLPFARKKSLQRFLEKRKERMASLSPYAASESHAVEKKSEQV
ncbi:hypothetical protein IFM89_031231 [Coptis chinensis]|uniref:Protein TIFY n=1 Tax=Coptis chinensis TaxID=261450 RepID=A0A835ISV1_9MAGN|nr:hypothetical protein IFM89_031231 [Coptis chinensis]